MSSKWENLRLGEVAETSKISGESVGAENYVGLEHLKTRSPKIQGSIPVSEVSSATTGFRAGDVLFGRLRPYLHKVANATYSGCCTNEILVWRPRNIDTLLPGFLSLILQKDSTIAYATSMSAGSRMPRVTAKSMSEMSTLVPPLPEQRRIVDLIGALDDAIEAAEESAASSSEVSKSLRNELFSKLQGRVSTARAGSMFEVMLGRQKSARQLHGDHEIPYLRAANILHGSLKLDDVQTMNFEPAEQEKYCLRPGDVLVVEGGSIGQTAIWQGEIEKPVAFDKHVIRLRGVEGKTISAYANQWARWSYETGTFQEQARGVTIKALGLQRAKEMPVPDITLNEQMKLSEILESSDSAVEQSRQHAQSLRSLRTELLTALLSGDHEIPESYDSVMELAGA